MQGGDPMARMGPCAMDVSPWHGWVPMAGTPVLCPMGPVGPQGPLGWLCPPAMAVPVVSGRRQVPTARPSPVC